MQKISVITRVSVISAFLVGFFFIYQANAQFPGRKLGGPVAEAKSEASVLTKAPVLEIHIANNGLVLLRGATVISISGDTIRVNVVWDSADFIWEVRTIPFFTKFLTLKGQKETLSDIRVGDIVTITGKLVKGGAEPMVDAGFIREQQEKSVAIMQASERL